MCSCSSATARITVIAGIQRGEHAGQATAARRGWRAGSTCSRAASQIPAINAMREYPAAQQAWTSCLREGQRHDQQRRRDARDHQRPETRVRARRGPRKTKYTPNPRPDRRAPARGSARAIATVRVVLGGAADQHHRDQPERDAEPRRQLRSLADHDPDHHRHDRREHRGHRRDDVHRRHGHQAVHDEDADQPGQHRRAARTATTRAVEVPGKNGSIAAISTAPTG